MCVVWLAEVGLKVCTLGCLRGELSSMDLFSLFCLVLSWTLVFLICASPTLSLSLSLSLKISPTVWSSVLQDVSSLHFWYFVTGVLGLADLSAVVHRRKTGRWSGRGDRTASRRRTAGHGAKPQKV
jgi:hypothetical protein